MSGATSKVVAFEDTHPVAERAKRKYVRRVKTPTTELAGRMPSGMDNKLMNEWVYPAVHLLTVEAKSEKDAMRILAGKDPVTGEQQTLTAQQWERLKSTKEFKYVLSCGLNTQLQIALSRSISHHTNVLTVGAEKEKAEAADQLSRLYARMSKEGPIISVNNFSGPAMPGPANATVISADMRERLAEIPEAEIEEESDAEQPVE